MIGLVLYSFRVVTYNILADVYADSDFSRDYLFAHCPPEILSIDYRKQLLLKELVGRLLMLSSSVVRIGCLLHLQLPV